MYVSVPGTSTKKVYKVIQSKTIIIEMKDTYTESSDNIIEMRKRLVVSKG